ncbi:hypothetical protein K503DRAFT_73116 [Rhizopogon vinicolor AM-OR11-026]|uniref:Uncharacterized protein n=1 Tax=Rhizopogon vinicolor AM-OR11-026 TaxID=1314800 RepID=A0A1B7N435_9AGAM|nr:hypothetical protein K503DRAFT_73116 [Rhizopogon vinicolor AM-OR11-026]
MSNTGSSPERPKIGSSEIEYTADAERKESVLGAAEDSSGEELEEASPSVSTATAERKRRRKKEDPQRRELIKERNRRNKQAQRQREKRKAKDGNQEVKVSLAEPSPPRSRCNSQEGQVLSAKPLSKAGGPTSHASSVISPDDSTHHESPSIRSVRAKSSDNISPASKSNCPDSPDNDIDETSSIAESSFGGRIRRSEPERIQYFKDQSQCDDVEPHRAHCTRCDKWISLGKKQTYVVRPWENHRRKCDQRPPVSKESRRGEPEVEKPEGDTSVSETSVDVIKQSSLQSAGGEVEVKVEKRNPEGDLSVSGSSLDITKQSSPQSARRNDAERKAFLEADPRAQEIKPHEVLCRSCQKWIKLSGTHFYLLGNWHTHQQRCSGVVPNSRVATAERKISLLNDPQVKSSSPRNVECAFCRMNVELDGTAQYDLTKWHEHKAKCSSPAVQPTPKAPASRLSRVFPPPSDQSFVHTSSSRVYIPATPVNSASTNPTVINDASLSRAGEKRPRDDEDTLEERPVNRPRTEAYQAPKHEAPGPWGWFMQPLKAFVRGFREGLGNPST